MRLKPLVKKGLFLSILSVSSAWSVEDLGKVSEGLTNPLAEAAIQNYRNEFEAIRVEEADIKISSGWELPYTIPGIEAFFGSPLQLPSTASQWSDAIEAAENKADLYRVAKKILSASNGSVVPSGALHKMKIPEQIPSLFLPLQKLSEGIQMARPLLNKAVDSISPEARRGFLALNEWPDPDTGTIKQEISSRQTKRRFEAMKTFSEASLLAAGEPLIEAIDQALPLLTMAHSIKSRVRWRAPEGVYLVSGPGDDVYDEKDLKDVTVLIDLGGKNTYRAPVARALEKEIRVVIDFGTDVTIEGREDLHGNAGCGVFGIGVLVLAEPRGIKELHTGPFSQGVGIAGIGALFLNGTVHATADRYVQGASSFGVGIFSAQNGSQSNYTAIRSGQGSALTRGVAIFFHEGDGADIKGGLVEPDPREPLGSVSLCQGVGFGPRAYAGGGLGFAIVKGHNVSVRGSYFSQGVGYWHGMGVFRLRGDHNILQARRYDMGSGVHSAFGHFDVYGNANRILNWGVGPAYGWDHSVGSALFEGNDNEVQVEWGAGSASIGSLSFSYSRLNNAKIKAGDFGTTTFTNNEPSYAIHVIEGTENQLQAAGSAEAPSGHRRYMRSPWGVLGLEGTRLVENLHLQPPEWPPLPREEAIDREMVDLQAKIEATTQKTSTEEVGDLVDIAAAFSLDKTSPREALKRLLTLPKDKLPALVEILEPAAVDQLIQLSHVLPPHGDAMAEVILEGLNEMPLQKKTVLVNMLRMFRPATICPKILSILSDPKEERLKGAVLRTMGLLLNNDTGEEPGMRAALLALSDHLHKPKNKSLRARAQDILQKMRFGDGFALLAVATLLDDNKRLEFLGSAPEDLTSSLQTEGAKTFLRIVDGSRKESLDLVSAQLTALSEAEPSVRALATEMLTSTRPAVVAAATIALGQVSHPHDVPLFEPLLNHERAAVREAAAVALARTGEIGLPILTRVLSGGTLRSRLAVLAGTSQATSIKSIALLQKALSDPNPVVRLTAIQVIHRCPPILQKNRPKMINFAQKKLSREEDPDVQLALALLK